MYILYFTIKIAKLKIFKNRLTLQRSKKYHQLLGNVHCAMYIIMNKNKKLQITYISARKYFYYIIVYIYNL